MRVVFPISNKKWDQEKKKQDVKFVCKLEYERCAMLAHTYHFPERPCTLHVQSSHPSARQRAGTNLMVIIINVDSADHNGGRKRKEEGGGIAFVWMLCDLDFLGSQFPKYTFILIILRQHLLSKPGFSKLLGSRDQLQERHFPQRQLHNPPTK